jgi:hypothetical protein
LWARVTRVLLFLSKLNSGLCKSSKFIPRSIRGLAFALRAKRKRIKMFKDLALLVLGLVMFLIGLVTAINFYVYGIK